MGISTLASLFSLFAQRAFHKSFAIKCIHTLFKNCRGVTLNSNSHFGSHPVHPSGAISRTASQNPPSSEASLRTQRLSAPHSSPLVTLEVSALNSSPPALH
jgi:hypothetical protein